MKQVLLKQLNRMAALLFIALLVPMGAGAQEETNVSCTVHANVGDVLNIGDIRDGDRKPLMNGNIVSANGGNPNVAVTPIEYLGINETMGEPSYKVGPNLYVIGAGSTNFSFTSHQYQWSMMGVTIGGIINGSLLVIVNRNIPQPEYSGFDGEKDGKKVKKHTMGMAWDAPSVSFKAPKINTETSESGETVYSQGYDVMPYTITSSNPSVATIVDNQVTIVAPGETEITYTTEESETSESSSFSYILIVEPAPVEKKNVNMWFEEAGYEVTLGDVLTVTAKSDPVVQPIIYSSEDETVAKVDAQTGAITALQVGSTIVYAKFAGNDEFNEASASYVLTVKEYHAKGYGITILGDEITEAKTSGDIPEAYGTGSWTFDPDTRTLTITGMNITDAGMIGLKGGIIETVRTGWTEDMDDYSFTIVFNGENKANNVMGGIMVHHQGSITIMGGTDDASLTLNGNYYMLNGDFTIDGIKVRLTAQEDCVMKMMKGTEFIGEYIKDVKGTVTINYNNTADTWYFAFTGESETPSGARRAPAAGSGLKVFKIKIVPAGGGGTAILEINAETGQYEVYNLQGQCVTSPVKGLFIINGKKVVIK